MEEVLNPSLRGKAIGIQQTEVPHGDLQLRRQEPRRAEDEKRRRGESIVPYRDQIEGRFCLLRDDSMRATEKMLHSIGLSDSFPYVRDISIPTFLL